MAEVYWCGGNNSNANYFRVLEEIATFIKINVQNRPIV
jgi:hypothetical protein